MKSLWLILAVLTTMATGCSGGKYPIEGRVFWVDGKPATELAGYSVEFESHETKRSATGTITAQGTFDLSTDAVGDGVYPATYKIAVNPPLATGDGPTIRSILPANYGNPATSGLEETIDGKKRVVELKLERRKKGK